MEFLHGMRDPSATADTVLGYKYGMIQYRGTNMGVDILSALTLTMISRFVHYYNF